MSSAEPNNLAGLIAERLGYMRDVAAYKWQHGLPITDLAREHVVINTGMIAGLSRGMTRESSEGFYRSQINAAKVIQHCWHERWRGTSEPASNVDLRGVIRPALIDLGNRIAALLPDAALDPLEFIQVVQIECLSNKAKQEILDAAGEIRLYASRFHQIRDSGLLRVGTTGDYAPFSFSADGENFAGIDIDLAHELAAHLNVSAILVRTSWPALMRDFAAGEFDIGMSGISITEQRKQQALFSKPYHVGGKTPIARCDRINSFSSIPAIDQPGTRLIVNPGGTNEKFLDANFSRATKVLHEDNRRVFELIVDGAADLMITDKIEVALQSVLHPQLCGLAGNVTFTYQEKGYLIPRDPELQAAVNIWLVRTRQNGRLRDVFDRHLSGN